MTEAHIIKPLFDYQQKIYEWLVPSLLRSHRAKLGFNINFIFSGPLGVRGEIKLKLPPRIAFSSQLKESLEFLFSYYWRGWFPAASRQGFPPAHFALPLPDYQIRIYLPLWEALPPRLEASVNLAISTASTLSSKLEHLLTLALTARRAYLPLIMRNTGSEPSRLILFDYQNAIYPPLLLYASKHPSMEASISLRFSPQEIFSEELKKLLNCVLTASYLRIHPFIIDELIYLMTHPSFCFPREFQEGLSFKGASISSFSLLTPLEMDIRSLAIISGKIQFLYLAQLLANPLGALGLTRVCRQFLNIQSYFLTEIPSEEGLYLAILSSQPNFQSEFIQEYTVAEYLRTDFTQSIIKLLDLNLWLNYIADESPLLFIQPIGFSKKIPLNLLTEYKSIPVLIEPLVDIEITKNFFLTSILGFTHEFREFLANKFNIKFEFPIIFSLLYHFTFNPLIVLCHTNYFWQYLMKPDIHLYSLLHLIHEYKIHPILFLSHYFNISGIKIFFEEEKETPLFNITLSFQELLIQALSLAGYLILKLREINRKLIFIQIREKLQPEIFITNLGWLPAAMFSPELLSVYLNFETFLQKARGLLPCEMMSFGLYYHQTNMKTYSTNLSLDFLIDILMDVWINVFEYVDVLLKIPWIIIPPS